MNHEASREVNRITKLSGPEKWTSFRYGCTLLLHRARVLNVVTRLEPRPEPNLNENQEVANQNLIDAWDMKDAEARIIIFCNVEGPQQTLIEGCASSAEMWERLILQYANAAPINGNLLLEKFFNYKYNPEHRVLDHVAVYTNLAEELRNLESPVTEQQLVVKIIQTLPPSFRSFRSAWDNLPRNEQTIANLTPRLVNEEAISRAANNGAMDPTDAFFPRPSLRSTRPRLPLSPGRALQRHPQGKVSTTQHTRKGDSVAVDEAPTLRVNGEDAAEEEEEEEVEVVGAPIRTTTHTHEKMDNNKTISSKAANMPAQSSPS